MKKVIFAIGKFNPMTWGHEKIINTVIEEAEKEEAESFVFVSNRYDPMNKDPLSPFIKMKYLNNMFPEANFQHKFSNNLFMILQEFSKNGYKDVTIVTGSDRANKFRTEVQKYIGHPHKSISLKFDRFRVIDVGSRNNTISSTKMREFVLEDDFEAFKEGLPSVVTEEIGLSIFNDIKKAKGIQ